MVEPDNYDMPIRSLEELQDPDEGSRRFTPLGFQTAGLPDARDAALHHQQSIASILLAPDVPENTRRLFERLRVLHTYGILCYDLYTVVDELASMFIETAFRDRFMGYYEGGPIPFENRDGPAPLGARNFEQVRDAFRGRGGSHKKKQHFLPNQSGCKGEPFNPGFEGLIEWARNQGWLPGQRNRHYEKLLIKIRNHAAHPSFGIRSPIESVRAIHEMAEIVNRIWGHETGRGRRYTDSLTRYPYLVSWDAEGLGRYLTPPLTMRAKGVQRDHTYMVVRVPGDEYGPHNDMNLFEYDARFELTGYPVEYLWGPGSWQEAVAWIEDEEPGTDTVRWLDRLFVVREHGGSIDVARSPGVFIGLQDISREGAWWLIRADTPADAFVHVRNFVTEREKPKLEPASTIVITPPPQDPHPLGLHGPCTDQGQCPMCAVETLAVGTWEQVRECKELIGVEPIVVPENAFVPSWRALRR